MKKLGMLFILMIIAIIPASAQTTEISAEIEEQLITIETFVSENRGLPILDPILRRFITREEARTIVLEDMEKESAIEGMKQRELFYRALGFWNNDNLLSESFSDYISVAASGFYSTSLGEMTIILSEDEPSGNILPLLEQVVYAHEFVHALQDQHFGIAEDRVSDNVDQFMAYRAFVEGDASLVMRNYLTYAVQNNLGDANSLQSPTTAIDVVNNTPIILINEQNFAYSNGLAFVMYLRSNNAGGWDAVNDVYANLPQSSEQILYPSKYLAGEAPIPVELADISVVLGDEWQHSATSTIGLFYLSEYLSQYIAGAMAYQATNGWGGDTMTIYHQSDTDELAWALGITWDEPIEREQREFSDLYTQILEMQFDEFTNTPFCGVSDEQSTCFVDTATTTFIASAPTLDMAQAILTHITEE
jgi:hypothetical protein